MVEWWITELSHLHNFLTLAFMQTYSQEQKVIFQLLQGDLPAIEQVRDLQVLFDLFQRHRLFSVSGPVKMQLAVDQQEKWKEVHQQKSMHSLQLSSESVELIKYLSKYEIRAINTTSTTSLVDSIFFEKVIIIDIINIILQN